MPFILTGQVRDHGGPGVAPPVLVRIAGAIVLVNPRVVDQMGGAIVFSTRGAARALAAPLPGRWRVVEVESEPDHATGRASRVRERLATGLDFDGDMTERD